MLRMELEAFGYVFVPTYVKGIAAVMCVFHGQPLHETRVIGYYFGTVEERWEQAVDAAITHRVMLRLER